MTLGPPRERDARRAEGGKPLPAGGALAVTGLSGSARPVRPSDLVERMFPVLLLLPLVALLLVLSVYPAFRLIPLAFSTFSFTGGEFVDEFSGLTNLRRMLNDGDLPIILRNTAIFVVVSVAIEFVLALGLAVAVNRGSRVATVLKAIFALPILVPPIVIGTVWRLMYNPDIGIINEVLRGVGLPAQTWLSDPEYALFAIIAVDVWHWTSFLFLILLAGLQSIPREPLEAAQVDGASPWQSLRTVTLPLLRPAMFVAILFRTVFAFKVFDEIFLLTSGGPGNSTEVLSLYIYRIVFRFSDFGYGALLSLLTIVFVLISLLISHRLVRVEGVNP
ncbi:MAG: carbohydrate ABC transporter permease [Thermomicrobiales bacterium]